MGAFIIFLCVFLGCGRSAQDYVEAGERALKAYNLEEAERDYQKAIDLEPNNARALYGMGWVLNMKRNIPAARIYFERAIQADPKYYGGYKGMGSIHLAMGFYEQAEASFKTALRLKPDDAATHGSLGYVYLVTKRLDLAEKAFRKALELEPDRGEIHYLLAELRAKQGAYDAALEELEQGESKPFEEVKFKLLGDELRARLYLRKALKALPSVSTPDEKGRADLEARLRDIERADAALSRALKTSIVMEKVRLRRLGKKIEAARARLKRRLKEGDAEGHAASDG